MNIDEIDERTHEVRRDIDTACFVGAKVGPRVAFPFEEVAGEAGALGLGGTNSCLDGLAVALFFDTRTTPERGTLLAESAGTGVRGGVKVGTLEELAAGSLQGNEVLARLVSKGTLTFCADFGVDGNSEPDCVAL